jgi:hypothetical protein
MSKVDVNLSDSGENAAIFYNLEYRANHFGGNHTETEFKIANWSGNELDIQVATYQTNATNRSELVWHTVGGASSFSGLKISFRGSCENDEFLRMLQLILEAEKMVEIIKP